jgi:hypothetical protein
MFELLCPKCNENNILYKTERGIREAKIKNTICKECKSKLFWTRNCPKCGKERKYNNKITFEIANKNNSLCQSCINSNRIYTNETKKLMSEKLKKFYCSDKGKLHKKTNSLLLKGKTFEKLYGKEKAIEIKSKISKGSKGEKNGFYGKKHSIETIKKMSDIKIGKMAGEKNPMYGKPSPPGSGNGWSGWYKNWFFRSLKELSYMINVIERFKFDWISGESRKYVIQYVDHGGVNRNYFPDFIVNDKYLVEVKPRKLFNSEKISAKRDAAIEWCRPRGLKYKLIDPIRIEDSKVKELYDSGKIKFTDRYEKIYQEKYGKNE